MAHARMTHARTTSIPASRAGEARRLFFKPDRPRAIDRHIDYFGGAGGATWTIDDDLCGEALLERLA